MDENMNNESNETGGGQQSSQSQGNYEYGQSGQNTYQSSYSNEYGSNQYSGSHAGGGSGTGGNDNGNKKKGKGGKIALAVVLAAIFGVCAGAGAYGISRATGSSSKQVAQAESTEDSSDEDSENRRSIPGQERIEDSSTEDSESEESSSEESTESSSSDEDSENELHLDVKDGKAVTTDVTEVVSEVMPAIVSVYNNYTQTGRDFFGQTYSQESTATGSGIIIGQTDDELLIATNNHVVEGEDSLEVLFVDNTTADADLKGTDSTNDLAVIAVSLDDLDKDTLDAIAIANLGSSDNLKVGEPVIAIGNALGYGQSVTTGVVSALNREITSEDGVTGTYIQTDAAINPGNSGGALVDLNGNVIGINSAKTGGTTVEGMGYAIPMSKAAPIIEDLMNQTTRSKVADEDKGYLGISGASVTSDVSAAYNMPQGVYVAQIIDGGGAADSDLQKGDIITAINGSTVTSMDELQEQLEYCKAGETVTVTVERASGSGEYEEKEIKVTLGDASTIEDAQSSSQGSSSGSQNGGQQNPSDGDSSSDGDESGDGYYRFPWNQW